MLAILRPEQSAASPSFWVDGEYCEHETDKTVQKLVGLARWKRFCGHHCCTGLLHPNERQVMVNLWKESLNYDEGAFIVTARLPDLICTSYSLIVNLFALNTLHQVFAQMSSTGSFEMKYCPVDVSLVEFVWIVFPSFKAPFSTTPPPGTGFLWRAFAPLRTVKFALCILKH